MYEWIETSELDFARERREALKMERLAWARCHRERVGLMIKLSKIKEALEGRAQQGG